ncbi:MAG: ABC transporter substrate-binding protein [Candidatus Atribacteria bacterium]|nr:ABC transporter substrate-binding protein [Candidatus Atribacteria bacterium]
MLRRFFICLLSVLVILSVVGGMGFVFAAQGKVDVVKVGVTLPLSGSLATTGNLTKKAMELAVEVVNNKYENLNLPMAETEGFPNFGGAKLELVFLDDQSNPEKGMSAVDQLITQQKVCAVMGSIASSVTATASQAAERLGIPFLNPLSTSPGLTERGFKWFFRCTPDDDLFSRNFFQFMVEVKEKKGIDLGKTISLLYENTLWGSDVAKAIHKYASQFGYEIIADLPYTAKSASLTSEIQRLKGVNADIVMLASYVSDAILIQTTMKDLNYIPPVILAMDSGHNDPNFIATVGDLANYIVSREIFTSTLLENPTVAKVNEMMIVKTGFPLVQSTAQGFMGTLIMADAISRAKSLDPEDIRAALAETNIPKEKLIFPWEGCKFNEKGQVSTGRGIMVQILEQKYIPVWPFEIANVEPILPIPAWDKR